MPAKLPRKTPRYSKIGFKPAEIVVETEGGTSEPVSAFVIGGVGIHRQLYVRGAVSIDPNPKKRLWVVTHLPTGMAIPRKFKYRKDAERIARAAARAFHGTTQNPAGTIRGQKFWNAFKSWMRDNWGLYTL